MQPNLDHTRRRRRRRREKESLLTRAWRFGRSLIVGAGATAADLTTLTILVEVFHLAPQTANVPSLLVGLTAQFIGARHWVFRAGEGNLGRHLSFFLLAETGALILNAVLFWVAVTYTPIPFWAARPLGTFLVYVGFSYPAWKRIFRVESAREEATHEERRKVDGGPSTAPPPEPPSHVEAPPHHEVRRRVHGR